MATTPEGRVKNTVKKVLDKYKSRLDVFWPVPGGYGESHLDCIVCAAGRYITIETKAPGKKPTPRQKSRIMSVNRAGGYVFVIDGTSATDTVEQLDKVISTILADAEELE